MEIDPDSLAEAFKRHLEEKMTNHVCESCGKDEWTILVEHSRPSDYFIFSTGSLPGEKSTANWPFGGIACTNCHLVRWFAIGPVLRAWKESKGGAEKS